MVYKTKGTCSVEINFDVIDGRLHDVKFTGADAMVTSRVSELS